MAARQWAHHHKKKWKSVTHLKMMIYSFFTLYDTLALGLSKMASRKVRVDSLFLDEGFGTLDEEALETALETLSSLQQDGKLIGIISHVSALKERISTQINITPVSGGHSKLVGPSCNEVVNSEQKKRISD